jgi:hypothetical protein
VPEVVVRYGRTRRIRTAYRGQVLILTSDGGPCNRVEPNLIQVKQAVAVGIPAGECRAEIVGKVAGGTVVIDHGHVL